MIHMLFFHIVHQTVFHVLNNPVAILHNGCGHLQRRRAHKNELCRVLPCLDAADTGNSQIFQSLIRSHLLKETQSDGLYGFS